MKMKTDCVELCRRLAAWHSCKLAMYDPSSSGMPFDFSMSRRNASAAIFIELDGNSCKAATLLGPCCATPSKACEALLRFLTGKRWQAYSRAEWPASIYDPSGIMRCNWIGFSSLQELDLELTLRGV